MKLLLESLGECCLVRTGQTFRRAFHGVLTGQICAYSWPLHRRKTGIST